MSDKVFKKSKKIWLIMTGFSCNNNCVMCSTKPKSKNYSDRSTEEIKKDLIAGKKKNYKKVEFTGGEPTIRPDILNLIKRAKDLGYKEIAFSTNARMLSYDNFCQKAIENGLNRVTLTLNAHNSRLGHAISRTPTAFEQTVQGVKNLLKHPEVNISANTVPVQVNYKYLRQIGEFIHNLGINVWNILDLIPDGYAEDFYNILSIRMTDLSSSFNSLRNIIKKFHLVTFFDFPLCIFPSELRKDSHTNFITAQGRTEIQKQIGYQPKRFEKSADDFYEDVHKKRIRICQNCKFSKACGGVWINHLDLYGEQEIKYLATKHNCLK